ncbi:hypothetical protein N0V90_010805 [Kalmusia sp. IMI 367209]|nr:hypothetical protein N0V90_010805 [Kalmusia sp. IMI 367209]
MSIPQHASFITVCIPKVFRSSHLEDLANKFRTFKLLALKTSPEAFSAEFESESQLPLSDWLRRITQPGVVILICAAIPSDKSNELLSGNDADFDVLLRSEWVGMFTMIGPVSLSDYYFPSSGQPNPGPDGSEGIAKRLTQAALNHGMDVAREIGKEWDKKPRTRFRLIVHPRNKDVVKMYERFGFKDSARMTLMEAYVANGDGEMVPDDADPEKWHSRLGIVMETLL